MTVEESIAHQQEEGISVVVKKGVQGAEKGTSGDERGPLHVDMANTKGKGVAHLAGCTGS